MRPTLQRFALCALLAAPMLLGASAPKSGKTTPIANGHGLGLSPGPESLALTFSLVQLADGSFVGHGKTQDHANGGWTKFDLTSATFLGDTLFMAGPVTKLKDAPPFLGVGSTVFFGIQDNGNGSGKPGVDSFANGVVPAFLPPGLTIQQILVLLGGPPPPEAFKPLASGNFKIH